MSWLNRRIEDITGLAVTAGESLHGGDIADVIALTLSDGSKLVAKTAQAGGADTAEFEAMMLLHINGAAPDCTVPEVIHAEPGLLVMSHIEHTGTGVSAGSAADAARQIAALHGASADHYGLAENTVIGPLPQINEASDSWVHFFGNCRLRYMAKLCTDAGQADERLLDGIESLIQKLGDIIPDTPPASLLHGDLWSGNILSCGERLAGLVDPAIYYGHSEVDLAFMTLFGNPGAAFFDAYSEIRPIEPGFFNERLTLYNLWPLLVHVRLFGGHYLQSVEVGLAKFGVEAT